ncbi:MAG: TonB-dependent receptor [Flavisolibacter sp.]
MKRQIIYVVALIGFQSAQGQDTTSKQLAAVVITTTKFPQKQNQTGKTITVISREEIARSSGKTIGELLDQQAGITVIGSQNALGTNQDIYMRGASSGNTLILIDGIPAYDPSQIANNFDINTLGMDNIERIEIVRGAMSTLYGSDAVAGVINIITKTGAAKSLSLYGSITAGSYGTHKEVFGISGSSGKSIYTVQYTHFQSAGFSTAYDSTGNQNFDKDAFNQNLLYGSFAHHFSDHLLWKVQGQLGKYTTGLDDGPFVDNKDYTLATKNLQLGTGMEYQYNKVTLYFNYNFNYTDRHYLDDSTLDVSAYQTFMESYYTGRSHFAELYTNYHFTDKSTLLIGLDYRYQNTDQHYLSISSYGPYRADLGSDSANARQSSLYASVFVQPFGSFHFEAGGRLNHHSKYGNNVTYTFNPFYFLNPNLKITGNVSSAFKAPSLYQLFDATVGLRTLKPETSVTTEAGVEYISSSKSWSGRLTYFTRSITHGIDYNFVTSHYFNNNSQKDHGLEAEASTHIGKISLHANYSFVTGKVSTATYNFDPNTYQYSVKGDTSFNNLYRRPKHAANLTVAFRATSKWYLSAHFRYMGERTEYQYLALPRVLPSYKTIDLYGEYAFSSHLKVYIDLKNITNEIYFDILGYTSRRFNFMGGISLDL